jgi:hypothetical protein
MDRSKYMRAPDAQLNLVWWLEQVSAAPDTAAVMSIVTQFIAAWPPQKIAEMPHACRPGRLVTADDVGTYATSLARAELAGVDGAPQVHAMYLFFTEASARISRLEAVKQREGWSSRLYLPSTDDK